MRKTNSAEGVMSAIKERKSVGGEKKGVKLLGIVKKLSEKRAAQKEEMGEKEDKKESKKEEASEQD